MKEHIEVVHKKILQLLNQCVIVISVLCLPQVPEEALAHSFVTSGSVMATSYNAKAVAMARRNAR